MKITDIRATVIWPGSAFVRVFTDDGIIGVGECSPMNCPVITNFINSVLKPILIGEDPIEIDRLWHKMFFRTYKLGVQGVQPEAIAGIDIAMWDILGKFTKLPIHALLGGVYRDKLQLYASI
nr:mandelate racemase/muconate lactonizing enzyme family protein [Candidatus Sigynarchaeota archaeon]